MSVCRGPKIGGGHLCPCPAAGGVVDQKICLSPSLVIMQNLVALMSYRAHPKNVDPWLRGRPNLAELQNLASF